MIPPIFLNFITVSLICLKTSLASDPQNKYNITGNILYLNNTNKTQPEGDLYIWRNSIELGEKPLTVIGRDGNQRYNISDWFINGEKVERGYVIEDTMGNFVNVINATNTPVSSLVGGDVALVLGHFESEVEPASFISYVTLLQKRKHRCHRVENNPFLISLGVTLQEPLAPIIVGAVQATS
ncbi:hypothetical protein BY996DRAFT_6413582 [Phakopsora pachyrhizi]|nr:hypothetical protein BY996DRAFT_6413582 [Phakopsora pachyrhizi]